MTIVNKIAPYPATVEDVTADGLARHIAVEAQRSYIKTMESAELDRNAMALFIQEWTVVRLLRALQEHAGTDVANEVARDIWDAWESGDSLGEFLWEWLTEYGIDPSVVA